MNNPFREPVSGFTHLFGAIVSFIGLLLLIVRVCLSPVFLDLKLLGVIIFGLSLMFLYTASSIYHLVNSSDKVIKFLRKLDHSMIYVLIAGTYTPICLIILTGSLRWYIFSAIWLMAISGILFKMVWFNCPRWISTCFYLIMGWFVILFISPISKTLPLVGMILLFLGGIFYTVGGVLYATKWPKLNLRFFGFHEIFHIFVLLGSFCHFLCIFNYVV